MRQFQFYEFVGIVVPGSVLLVGVALVAPGSMPPVFLPSSTSALGIHALLAYAAGHVVQAAGNLFEKAYWGAQSGMPTDWPCTRMGKSPWPDAYGTVSRLVQINLDLRQVSAWRRAVATLRSMCYAQGQAERLETFNGNYGLCRGVLAAVIAIVTVGALLHSIGPPGYLVLVLLAGLSLYRMDRFGRHYASELFSWAAAQRSERGIQ